MLSCALHLLQLAGLSPGLDPMNVDGYGGKAHTCTPVPLGLATGPGCASQRTLCGGRTGGGCEHEPRRGSAGLFLQLESPSVLVVSVWGGQLIFCASVVKLWGWLVWFF